LQSSACTSRRIDESLYDPSSGGALLERAGIYPVSLAHFVFGAPARVQAVSDPTFTGVDEQTSVLLHYDGGRQAMLTANLGVELPNRAVIAGEEAAIEIDDRWHQARASISGASGVLGNASSFPTREMGFVTRQKSFARCLRAGETESPIMPLDATPRGDGDDG